MVALNARRWTFFSTLSLCVLCSNAEDRRFTVRDSIEMTTFSEPPRSEPGAQPPVSPDGRYFVVVTSRGIIESNKVESTIRLFDNQMVQSFLRQERSTAPSPAPRVLAKIAEVPIASAGGAYKPLISDLRWASDSQSLYYLAQNNVGQHYLCNVDIRAGRIRILSPQTDYDIERYSILNDLAVFTATRSVSDSATRAQLPGVKINEDASTITGLSIDSILFPNTGGLPTPRFRELWWSRKGQSHLMANASSAILGHDMAKYVDVLSVSPDGRYVVKLNPVSKVPPSWQAYMTLPGFEDWQANLTNMSPANYWRPRQYALVDLANGNSRPLLDAPFGDSLAHLEAEQAIWSENGKRLLLTNTFLPLDGVDAVTHEKRLQLCTVADLEVETGETRCIAFTRDGGNPTPENPKPLRLQSTSFGATADEVVVHLGWPREGRWQTDWYRLSDGRWDLVKTAARDDSKSEAKEPEPKRPTALSITIKQSLNDPPILWAQDTATGTGKEIWNPNPQFATIKIGHADVYRWKDPSGNQFTGGLIEPVDYVPGQRYPLVIQTHGFEESEFLTDGPFPTGMAARSLASAGMMVLQVASNHLHYGELSEAHDQAVGYESAIDKLVSEGLVDPKRVGIIGFSRTCWYVETALIEDPNRFAAASINDGIDQSYVQSMLFDPDTPSETQRIYQSKPFGNGLQQWVKLAPGFHLDKVKAPILITAIKPVTVLQEWEIYSSLYQQKKPVDFLYIPNGQHVLQKPLDRMASQQENVDWFRFWLKSKEELAHDEPDEFMRWQKLRAMLHDEPSLDVNSPRLDQHLR